MTFFYERFVGGICRAPDLPRLTTRQSATQFSPRDEGLHVLLINAPIREWSFPNIFPIGHGYVGAVATMDGHRLSVLDLNAERGGPVKVDEEQFNRWIEGRVRETLADLEPDIIGLGGI